MAEVVLEKVTKIYPGAVKAVSDVDLSIVDGEFIVLVGPSGCGKSTTLRMVAGLEDITDGTIRIGEQVVNDVPPKDRNIAMVFQNYALYPHMSVYKNMAFALKLKKFPREEIDRRVREAATVLGIESLLERKPKALSGGQRQRVAVGRAIVRKPMAFLFDEPLSNLDAKLRVEMRAELKRLHRQLATTTIYVTHDQEEAMTLGDRICVMKDGVIHQCASPLDVYGAPANRFVAGFVGTPPMNFLPGRLEAADGEVTFTDGEMELRLTGQQAAAVSGWIGKEVVLGVRPQAISLEPVGRGGRSDDMIEARVKVIEPLGETMDVFASTETHDHLVARVDAARGIDMGQTIRLHLDMSRTHVFAPGVDGENLTAFAY